jgi:hypothetical protein
VSPNFDLCPWPSAQLSLNNACSSLPLPILTCTTQLNSVANIHIHTCSPYDNPLRLLARHSPCFPLHHAFRQRRSQPANGPPYTTPPPLIHFPITPSARLGCPPPTCPLGPDSPRIDGQHVPNLFWLFAEASSGQLVQPEDRLFGHTSRPTREGKETAREG